MTCSRRGPAHLVDTKFCPQCGEPVAPEDLAERARYAALHLPGLRVSARDIKRRHGTDLPTRIGLKSGEVVVDACTGVRRQGAETVHLHAA